MTAISTGLRLVEGSWRNWLITTVVVGSLLFAGYWPRHIAKKKLLTEAGKAQQELPRVRVVVAVAAGGGRPLTLPGSLQAMRQALVNARATGYVTRCRVDIGDQVHAGDILAELDTPELDQQLQQARAARKQKDAAFEQAMANRDYARLTAARQDSLVAQGLSTTQDDEQANAQLRIGEANVHAAQADVDAADANVRELGQLVSFGRVIAPFDARITQRNVEVGSLVNTGAGISGASGATPMFRIEASNPIRVFIQVPQAFALSVSDGASASVSIRQLPGRVFEGHVARTAGTLDPASRTLNTEVDVSNPAAELMAGMFAQVTIDVAVSHRVVRVPSSAVIMDARGVHVATVDATGYVHLAAVQSGRDDGRELELVDGLVGGENVIVSPSGDLVEGGRVEVLR